MARQRTVVLVCDGCKAEMDAETEGTSQVHVDVKGADTTSRLDLCPDCTKKLPEGTKRKRPEKKEQTEEAPASGKK